MPEETLLSVRGGAFQSQVFAAGQGRPLVYLHGAGGPLGGWATCLEALARQFRVYAPVHPGYGKSTGLEQIDNALEMGFYYLDWLDAAGLDRVCLVGHSMGGMIAAEIASIAPHRAEKLVLANAAGFWLDEAPIPDFFVMTPAESRDVLFHDPASPLAMMMLPDSPPPPEVLLEVLGAFASSAKLLWPLPSDPALLKRLHRLTMPALVLWGESDRLIPPAHARAWERALPDARVVMLPGTGHLPQYEQPEAWVQAVLEFAGAPELVTV
jgi:pimeloyl-ACP methyl ester carboxylesterase